MSTAKYLSCAETAKLLRQALKAEFGGTKFSVRSRTYAGGASIDVEWTDGPPADAVKATTDLYTGASFDGMIDLKSYHDTVLVRTRRRAAGRPLRRRLYLHQPQRLRRPVGAVHPGDRRRRPGGFGT